MKSVEARTEGIGYVLHIGECKYFLSRRSCWARAATQGGGAFWMNWAAFWGFFVGFMVANTATLIFVVIELRRFDKRLDRTREVAA